MEGTRRPDGTPAADLKPGDYCKVERRAVGNWGSFQGQMRADPGGPQWWLCCPPTWTWPKGWRDDGKTTTRGWPGRLNPAVHAIVEHEDGTITVLPSILQTVGIPGHETQVYHGYLERGVWREC